jgi:hypothetical protein
LPRRAAAHPTAEVRCPNPAGPVRRLPRSHLRRRIRARLRLIRAPRRRSNESTISTISQEKPAGKSGGFCFNAWPLLKAKVSRAGTWNQELNCLPENRAAREAMRCQPRNIGDRAAECMGWAKTARSDQERVTFLEMAQAWSQAAVVAERKSPFRNGAAPPAHSASCASSLDERIN